MVAAAEDSRQSSSLTLPYDTRPFIRDLLKDNASKIESVRSILQSDSNFNKCDNTSRYDDIWILRFLLSHKNNVKSAAKAAIETMHFREERKLNELGDIRHRAPSLRSPSPDVQFPCFLLYNSFSKSEFTFVHSLPDTNRGIMSYINVGEMDLHRAAVETSQEDNEMFHILQNEVFYQIQDEVTRRTGKLTKMIRVIDMGGLSRKDLSLDFVKRDGAASTLFEDCYPQLLGSTYFVNCPGWVSTVWAMLKHFFPKRAVEKMNFIGKHSTGKNAECFQAYVSHQHVPKQFGGSNPEWPRVDDLAVTFTKKD